MTDPTETDGALREPDHPAAYALAKHIADHPVSTIQAAFRYLNAPLTIELHEDPAVVSAAAPSTDHTTPSRRAGLRDEIVKVLGQIPTIPPVAHRRAQADNVLALLYREWPWLRAEADDDELTAEIANSRTMYDAASAREHDLIEERDRLLEAQAADRAADRAAVLTEAERTMLTYALDQAQERIWSEDGFTDEDQAAVTSLRRLAAEAPATNTQAACGCPHPADEHGVYGCADGCDCQWIPKKRPMDPVHILGIDAERSDPTQCSGEEGFCPEHGFHRHTLKQPAVVEPAEAAAETGTRFSPDEGIHGHDAFYETDHATTDTQDGGNRG